jgi:hypothetical protein
MYFEKFFEVARSMADSHALATARFNLGAARAAATAPAFFETVAGNMEQLLLWKNLRVPFCEQA